MKKLLLTLVLLFPALLQAATPAYSTTTRILNPSNLIYNADIVLTTNWLQVGQDQTNIGHMRVMADQDSTNIFGRVAFFTALTDQAYYAHVDNANGTDYAMKQTELGQTIFNTKSGQHIAWRFGNANRYIITDTNIHPNTDNLYNLGLPDRRWRLAWIGHGLTNFGDTFTSRLQVGTNGTSITNILTASAALTFTAVAAQTSQDQSITVTGVTTNDVVTLGIPFHVQGAGAINTTFSAFSSNDVVWVRMNNYSAVTRSTNGVFKVMVHKF